LHAPFGYTYIEGRNQEKRASNRFEFIALLPCVILLTCNKICSLYEALEVKYNDEANLFLFTARID
jgi:hypothetical protein